MAGGSGYVFTSGTVPNNGQIGGTYLLGSGYYLTNTSIVAGNASMPTKDGASTMTGNEGNGYAKITVIK